MNEISTNELRLPPEFRRSLRSHADRRGVLRILRAQGLNTVCEEARCPNIGECFSNKTATFMIMGDRCTRRCHFCSVTTKKPMPLDADEPFKIAQASISLGLDYVVVTSVDRDELPDYGAGHFVAVVKEIKAARSSTKVEVLTPDFRGKFHFLDQVLQSPIDVFGHNIETVARLYKSVRPQSNYETTKSVLARASTVDGLMVKSGLMVGLGECDDEVCETLLLLKNLGVHIVTIGQYLRPTLKHWPVARYVDDEAYARFRDYGLSIGLRHVFAGPFVRSSYHAKEAHHEAIA